MNYLAGTSAANTGNVPALTGDAVTEASVWQVLEQVLDPEIPVLSIVELGIVRWVRIGVDKNDLATARVGLAPTYTGCPATEVIAGDVVRALQQYGIAKPHTEQVLSPAWTTDWISASGRKKLLDYGIVPPAVAHGSKKSLLRDELAIACPRCQSTATSKVSEFGSTPCKSAYKCRDCLEPFEYFKCI